MSLKPAKTRGATCRANLLRLLAAAPRDALMLDVDASGWFGYVRRPEETPRPIRKDIAVPVLPCATAPSAQKCKQPLRLRFVHAIVRREPRQPPRRDAAAEEAFAHAAPIDEDAARAPSNKRLITYEDLLPAPRRLLGASRSGPLDLDRLTQLLAASHLPRRLPRRIYRRWHPDLVVLLDSARGCGPTAGTCTSSPSGSFVRSGAPECRCASSITAPRSVERLAGAPDWAGC